MVKTTKIQGGADYALVPDRIKEFREQNPKASITTTHEVSEDGSVIFTATIIADQSKNDSAKASGSARYTAEEMKPKKSFEKLETISIGRALAVLGYLNSGQVATTEEMDEFNEWKDQQAEEAVNALMECETLDELKDLWLKISYKDYEQVINAKDVRKEQLMERLEAETDKEALDHEGKTNSK